MINMTAGIKRHNIQIRALFHRGKSCGKRKIVSTVEDFILDRNKIKPNKNWEFVGI